MKQKRSWRVRLAAFCVAGACLVGTGAVLAAGGESDPLVTLSYLNQKVLPDLLKQAQSDADQRQKELTAQFEEVTREQVSAVARKLELDTVYFLKGKEG